MNFNKKTKKIFYSSIVVFFLTTPDLSFAATPKSFKELVANIVSIINGFIVLTMALSTVYFLFGILKYMTQYGDEKARAESVKTITYGLVALFVMVAIWGIVALLRTSLLGVGGAGIPQF